MKREYLGDTYDVVKRLWCDLLSEWSPLYAEARFIPEEIRSEYTLYTGIQILIRAPTTYYSILNDPDTGIRLPGFGNQREGRSHIVLPTIIRQLRSPRVKCVITFDMSHYRNIDQCAADQRQTKLRYLEQDNCHGFYYKSHAPFLFAASSRYELRKLRIILTRAGIPDMRLTK